MPTPAERWARRAERFAFLGNSLLRPMAAETALGLDEAFWDGFASDEAANPSLDGALGRLKAHARAVREADTPLKDAVRRVNVEYARLFIGPPKPAAPPWETLYAHPGQAGEVGFGRATVAMRNLLADAGFALANESNQYADHAGIELLYLSELCRRACDAAAGGDAAAGAEARASAFAREHPAAWLPAFRDRVAGTAPKGYYRGIVEAAEALCAAVSEGR